MYKYMFFVAATAVLWTFCFVVAEGIDGHPAGTTWRNARLVEARDFVKGQTLDDVCKVLSESTGVAVCLIAPVDMTLPADVVLKNKESDLGGAVDRLMASIPGTKVMAGKRDALILAVPVEQTVQRCLDANVADVSFKGTFVEFLETCPGVRDCGLSYATMPLGKKVIELSYKGTVSVQEILLDAAIAWKGRFVIRVAPNAVKLYMGTTEHSVVIRSISLYPFEFSGATTQPSSVATHPQLPATRPQAAVTRPSSQSAGHRAGNEVRLPHKHVGNVLTVLHEIWQRATGVNIEVLTTSEVMPQPYDVMPLGNDVEIESGQYSIRELVSRLQTRARPVAAILCDEQSNIAVRIAGEVNNPLDRELPQGLNGQFTKDDLLRELNKQVADLKIGTVNVYSIGSHKKESAVNIAVPKNATVRYALNNFARRAGVQWWATIYHAPLEFKCKNKDGVEEVAMWGPRVWMRFIPNPRMADEKQSEQEQGSRKPEADIKSATD